MQISGKSPVDRAVSAADLLIDGKVSDSYIRVYKTETARAELLIADMLAKTATDALAYADVADAVPDWILLYGRVKLLQERYPNGLTGKKETARFKYVDYTSLQKTAELKACEALYAKARFIYESASVPEAALEAMPYLYRSKKYSNHLAKETDDLGAQICFSAAEKFSVSEDPKTLLKAAQYYEQANAWISGYKDSLKKSDLFKEKAARLYVEEADAKMHLCNYTAFRQAKEAYIQAERIVSGSASQQLADVNEKLTLRLTIIYGGLNSRYPDEDRVKKAMQSAISSSVMGPDKLELRFVRDSGRLGLLFASFENEDIILIPADNFGEVKEIYGPVETVKINISKTIDGVVYTGTIIEQNQKVTVFFQNDSFVYDMRKGRKTLLDVFEDDAHKTTKTFTARIYQGDDKAKPNNFDAGALYVSGQYNLFFPNFRQKNDDYVPIMQNFGTLNEAGKRLCWIISNLQYVPH